MRRILNQLENQKNKNSTKKVYLNIWRQFNKFVIKLDPLPKTWEERITLYVAFMVESGMQSSSIKTYLSAIKSMLAEDEYILDSTKLKLTSLTKACRITKDRVRTRLPIQKSLLELILFEVGNIFENEEVSQPFLRKLYQCLFILAYYGLFRIGELADTEHAVRAKDVHVAKNKDKILLLLHTSKTHGRGDPPQEIRITRDDEESRGRRNFCPFKLTREFTDEKKSYRKSNERFFSFKDGTGAKPSQVRQLLKLTLRNLGLNERLYGTHSFRIGRATDLSKMNYSVDSIKKLGRWRSNVVYKIHPLIRLNSSNFIKNIIAGTVVGVDSIWVIGDEAIDETYHQTFEKFSEEDCYARATFEVRAKTSKEFGSYIRSATGRIRNNVLRAINSYVSLPKFIVIIMEYDIMKKVNTSGMNEKQVRDVCFKLIRWLINEVRKLLAAHNDYLPKRAKRETKVVWVLPTLHHNYYSHENQVRIVLGQTLLTYAAQVENNLALELKQVWDENDASLYLYEQQRYTSDGIIAFWRAVDRTIRYADTIINKNITTRKPGRDIEIKRDKVESRYSENTANAKKFWKRKPKFPNAKFGKKGKFAKGKKQ